MDARINLEVRRRVYRRDGYRCALCDSTSGLQIHHVVPRGEGGPVNSMANMIALCWKCHAAAHGVIHPDYAGQITQDEIDQAIVEYMSDYYANTYGAAWSPWGVEKTIPDMGYPPLDDDATTVTYLPF